MSNMTQIILIEILILELLLFVLLLLIYYKRKRNSPSQIHTSSKTNAKQTQITKKPKIAKFTSFLAVLIPITIVLFIGYSNFIASHEFNYSYDIGVDNILSPKDRVSDFVNVGDISYQNITKNLVYFDVPVPRASNELDVEIKFQNNLPKNSAFYLGAKNAEEWSYSKSLIYSPAIEKLLKEYPYSQEGNLILLNLKLNYFNNYTIANFLKSPPKARIITYGLDKKLKTEEIIINDYSPSDFEINSVLRGSVNLYVYVKGNLEIEVSKRDLNMYENEDILTINVYDLQKNLIATKILADDGIKKISKEFNSEQTIKLSTNPLKEGVYKIELKNNGDMTINNIKFNQDKVVVESPTLYNAEYKLNSYSPEEKTISDALRGSHSFYIYAKGYIDLDVWKRDMNGYENEDELIITITDWNGKIVETETIPDDGITGKKSDKTNIANQKANIKTDNLIEGLYKLDLKTNDDVIITKIKVNQDNIVGVGNVFLASSTAYFNDLSKTSKVYFTTNDKDKKISAITYHAEGFQTLTIDEENLSISQKSVSYTSDIPVSTKTHELTSPKNDIKVSGMEFYSFDTGNKYDDNLDWYQKSPYNLYFKNKDSCKLSAKTYHDAGKQLIQIGNNYLQIKKTDEEYTKEIPFSSEIQNIKIPNGDIVLSGCGNMFSFTPDSWFNPFESEILDYKEDYNYLKEKADFILIKYTPAEINGDWITAQTSFNMEGLYIKDNKLNIMIEMPHLSKNETSKYQIPVDWISATLKKDGII